MYMKELLEIGLKKINYMIYILLIKKRRKNLNLNQSINVQNVVIKLLKKIIQDCVLTVNQNALQKSS